MGLFKKKKTSFEIGRDGTAEELVVANYKALSQNRNGDYLAFDVQRELQDGAVQAFKDGKPGNVQTILSHLSDFNIRCYTYIEKVSHQILSEITKGQDNPVAIINLALTNTSGHEKQGILNDSLLLCLDKPAWSDNAWKEALVAPLLAAGADINQGGKVLATAINEDQPPSIIQQLYTNGASFDEALAYMQSKDFGARDIENLSFYRKTAKAEQTIAELKETIAELTGKQPAAAEPAPQKTAPHTIRTNPITL